MDREKEIGGKNRNIPFERKKAEILATARKVASLLAGLFKPSLSYPKNDLPYIIIGCAMAIS